MGFQARLTSQRLPLLPSWSFLPVLKAPSPQPHPPQQSMVAPKGGWVVVDEFGSPIISTTAPKTVPRKHTVKVNAVHLLSRPPLDQTAAQVCPIETAWSATGLRSRG